MIYVDYCVCKWKTFFLKATICRFSFRSSTNSTCMQPPTELLEPALSLSPCKPQYSRQNSQEGQWCEDMKPISFFKGLSTRYCGLMPRPNTWFAAVRNARSDHFLQNLFPSPGSRKRRNKWHIDFALLDRRLFGLFGFQAFQAFRAFQAFPAGVRGACGACGAWWWQTMHGTTHQLCEIADPFWRHCKNYYQQKKARNTVEHTRTMNHSKHLDSPRHLKRHLLWCYLSSLVVIAGNNQPLDSLAQTSSPILTSLKDSYKLLRTDNAFNAFNATMPLAMVKWCEMTGRNRRSSWPGHVLEIASGSGCHVEHFAPNFPQLNCTHFKDVF